MSRFSLKRIDLYSKMTLNMIIRGHVCKRNGYMAKLNGVIIIVESDLMILLKYR